MDIVKNLVAAADPAGLLALAAFEGNLWAGAKARLGLFIDERADVERAVRAGLELVAAVSDLKTHAALQTRVGIATPARKIVRVILDNYAAHNPQVRQWLRKSTDPEHAHAVS